MIPGTIIATLAKPRVILGLIAVAGIIALTVWIALLRSDRDAWEAKASACEARHGVTAASLDQTLLDLAGMQRAAEVLIREGQTRNQAALDALQKAIDENKGVLEAASAIDLQAAPRADCRTPSEVRGAEL